MPKATVRLAFRGDVFNEPVLYQMGKQYQVVTNIRNAHVENEQGWLEVELDGEAHEIERALSFCREKGIEVEYL